MKTSLLAQIRPCSHTRFETLPVLGPVIEEFVEWLNKRGYRRESINTYMLPSVLKFVGWLRGRCICVLADLTEQTLITAYDRFHQHDPRFMGAIRTLQLFLCERGLIAERKPTEKLPLEIELERFATHLRDVRGFAERTVTRNVGHLSPFLKQIGFDQDKTSLSTLGHRQIEAFLQEAAKTNNRFSLQHIVATLRSYLRLLHACGILSRPLHEQIDTPRVYRLERLPRAVAWSQVQALLRSIDRNHPKGLRDFTILYLAAAYGVRSSELVHMKLEDIDWRHGLLRVPQTKTKQTLQLPLTDEAGDVLSRYLCKGRPPTQYRQLFLRVRAPVQPLVPTAIREILMHRVRRSGLELPSIGAHALRHSLAVHLLQQRVAMKTIGDVLGHRDAESTAIYLRLGTDDLRQVGLPVPRGNESSVPLKICANPNFPRIRSVIGPFKHPPSCFCSSFGKSMQRYLAIKCALGRKYSCERRTLLDWDIFLHQHQIRNVCPDAFQRWVKSLDHLTPTVRRSRMRIVRNFMLFHARDYPGSFVPDMAGFPKPHPKCLPRLISDQEMARVLNAAKQLPSSNSNPLRSQTMRLAFVLLYCCGLRRGELLQLRLEHFDAAQQLLRIEQTKFHKSRLVPLSSSVAAEVQSYLQLRRQNHLPMEEDEFLIWNGRRPENRRYTPTGLRHVWRCLCGATNVLDHRGNPPRLHDLRHSFAVNALHRWYVQGDDVQIKLPHLATYLGHVSPVSTHYYLHLTPELSQAASDRFHQRFTPLFVKGGAA